MSNDVQLSGSIIFPKEKEVGLTHLENQATDTTMYFFRLRSQ
jgi:hypothetical protein